MQRELRLIEEQLNKLCSQHDELMSLLEITDYLPNIKHFMNLNANLGTRISMIDRQISETLPTLNHRSQEEQEQAALKNQQFNQLINRSQKFLDELNQQIGSMAKNATLFETRASFISLDNLQQAQKSSLRSTVFQAQEDYAYEGAYQKRKMQRKQGIKGSIEMRLVTGIIYSYQKLETKMAEIRMSLDIPPLEQFCHFTSDRLQKQALSLRKRMIKGIERNFLGEKESIQRSLERLEYQLKGLKQLCGELLMLNKAQNGQRLQAHGVEKKVQAEISQLENFLKALPRALISD